MSNSLKMSKIFVSPNPGHVHVHFCSSCRWSESLKKPIIWRMCFAFGGNLIQKRSSNANKIRLCEAPKGSQKAETERFQSASRQVIEGPSTLRLSGCDVDLMTNGSKHLQALLSSVLHGREHSTTTLAIARASRVSYLLCCYVIGSCVWVNAFPHIA